MAFGEGSAGAGLQVSLESACDEFIGKLHRHDDDPRSISCGVTVQSVIVPSESAGDVRRESDVVSIGIALASEDVHEAFRLRHEREARRNRAEQFVEMRAANNNTGDWRSQLLRGVGKWWSEEGEVRLRRDSLRT